MSPNDMFLYHLPFSAHEELCRILDRDKRWEELAGNHMNLDMMRLYDLRRDDARGLSPTNQLLTFWGQHIHTVVHLFVLLSKMHHYQAMTVLKPYVDSRYHPLISEGEENINVVFDEGNTSASLSQMDENFGCHNFNGQVEEQDRIHHKELLPSVQETSEIKILNTSVVVGDDAEAKGDLAAPTVHVNSQSLELQPLQHPHKMESEYKENNDPAVLADKLSSKTSSWSPAHEVLEQTTDLPGTPLTSSSSPLGVVAGAVAASESVDTGMHLLSARSIEDAVSVDGIEDVDSQEGNMNTVPQDGNMHTQSEESVLTAIGKEPLAIFQF